MHVYTSITSNYLPKAHVLARSIKRFHPAAIFHLVCLDGVDGVPIEDRAIFDTVWTLNDLPIPNVRAWTFQHNVVECCTAIKGLAAQELLRRQGADRIYYFDPDIVVLAPLDELESLLDRYSYLLTPHLTEPETDLQGILDNEICALQHGIFNLGFLAVRATEQGRRFLDWWSARLLRFCHDDIPRGLFTDQRWIDLAPGFFPDVGVIRAPQCNVATWNLTHRKAHGRAPYEIQIDGRPLVFFHFSGLDSGAQEVMLARYGRESPVLIALRQWYLAECERAGQARHGRRRCPLDCFDDGTPITPAQRLLYRTRLDLQAAFPDPYRTADPAHSYRHWYEADAAARSHSSVTARLQAMEAEIQALRASRAWKLVQHWRRLRTTLTPRRPRLRRS